MKKLKMNKQQFFFLILFMILPIYVKAQYYNPYLNHDNANCSGKITCGACLGNGFCYGYVCFSCGGRGIIKCPVCEGYNIGKKAAEKALQERWNNPEDTYQDGLYALRNKKYTSALEKLKRSAELGNNQAIAFIGNMYELGMGTEVNRQTAEMWYNKGAQKNDPHSINNLNRVSQYGFWSPTEANCLRYIQNLNILWTQAGVKSQQIINSVDWNTSSGYKKSNKSNVCNSCNGTGVNPRPNTGGSLSNWVAYYNQNGIKCPYCYKITSHFHDKCSSCSIPSY